MKIHWSMFLFLGLMMGTMTAVMKNREAKKDSPEEVLLRNYGSGLIAKSVPSLASPSVPPGWRETEKGNYEDVQYVCMEETAGPGTVQLLFSTKASAQDLQDWVIKYLKAHKFQSFGRETWASLRTGREIYSMTMASRRGNAYMILSNIPRKNCQMILVVFSTAYDREGIPTSDKMVKHFAATK